MHVGSSKVTVPSPSPSPVRSASSADDMPPASPSEHIVYNSELGVLLCVPCGFAINNIKRHVPTYHPAWPQTMRKALARYQAQLALTHPNDVKVPSALSAPIPGLTLHKGWSCRRCPHFASTEDSMRQHSKVVHRWRVADAQLWDRADVQTVFPSSHCRYFPVTVAWGEGPSPVSARCLAAAAQDLLEKGRVEDSQRARQAMVVAEKQMAIDRTPWMMRTKWLDKFQGRNLLHMAAAAALPTRKEGSLLAVRSSVERVLGRCWEGVRRYAVEDDCHAVLCVLANPRKQHSNPKPFKLSYEGGTRARYVNLWVRVISCCLRMVHSEDGYGFVMDEGERQQLHRLWRVVERPHGDADEVDELVFQLSVRLWKHVRQPSSPRSLLVYCADVLGIDDRTGGTWRQANDFGQILAGLLFCGRLLLFEHALPSPARGAIASPIEAMRAIRDRWLVENEGTPFSHLLSLLAYAKSAGSADGGLIRVTWSRDHDTIYYQGQPLALPRFRQFVQDIRRDAEALLASTLLFLPGTRPPLPPVCLRDMRDNMNEASVGYSFVHDPHNQLAGGRDRVMARLLLSPSFRTLLRMSNGDLRFRPGGKKAYQEALARFQPWLFLLMHVLGGGPARGPEITTLRIANGHNNVRNLFVQDGQLLFVTSYHKTQSQSGQHKVIARFLPEWLGHMVVLYVAEVLPFAQLLGRHGHEDFVFGTASGLPTTFELTKWTKHETSVRLGIPLTFQDYRHLAIAIDREHVRGLVYGEEEAKDHAHDLSAAHSTKTADLVYGLDAAALRCLSSPLLDTFREVSHKWHHFLHMGHAPMAPLPRSGASPRGHGTRQRGPSPPRRTGTRPPLLGLVAPTKRTSPDDPSCDLPMAKRPPLVHHTDQLEAALHRLYGPMATFRSQAQRQAVMAVLAGDTPVMAVLPPGGGKSLLFQLPASLTADSGGVTVVVVPYRALREDLVRRCSAMGIPSSAWTPEKAVFETITLVVVETATSSRFRLAVQSVHEAGRLERIVVDECHTVKTATGYRHRIADLDSLRLIPCQFVLLTGTLPPTWEAYMEEAMCLSLRNHRPTYVRASTDRPNVTYLVTECVDGGLDDAIVQLVEELHARQGERPTVLFGKTTWECETLAGRLGCKPYHARHGHRDEALAEWVDGRELLLVATSALGAGVDLDNLAYVIHRDIPYGAVDFHQECGRAGRNGEPVVSIVMVEATRLRQLASGDGEADLNDSRRAMHAFLSTSGCRRERLTAFLDGEATSCMDSEATSPCDQCLRLQQHRREALAVGPSLYRAKVAREAKGRALLEQTMADIGDGCAACWLRGEASAQHDEKDCAWLTRELGASLGKIRIWFAQHSCCFQCGLPGDWCRAYLVEKKPCQGRNIVVVVVLSMWALGGPGRAWLEETSETCHPETFHRWLGRACRVVDTNGTNAAMAAIQLLQRFHRTSKSS